MSERSDAFSEFFDRFEEDVDTDEIEGWPELQLQIAHFYSKLKGHYWKGTQPQLKALKFEAENRHIAGFKPPEQEKKRVRPEYKYRRLRRFKRGEQVVSEPYYVYPETINANIKVKVEHGYSANQIQKQMRNQGIGIRRQVLLAQIRAQKGLPARPHPERYTPKKYRKRPQ